MAAVVTLLIIVTVSLLVTRVATVALTLTGMPRERARFQARCALTGTGFTTREAEDVMAHPVRRQIVLLLMLVGSAGFVTVIATILLGFTGVESTGDGLRRAAILLGGLLVLLFLARSRHADRWLSKMLERLLRRARRLDSRDYSPVLRLTGGWLVAEMKLGEDHWAAGRTLAEMDLPHEGVLVLGIERKDGRWDGAPKGSVALQAGDMVVLYGPEEALDAIDLRPRDDKAGREQGGAEQRFRSES